MATITTYLSSGAGWDASPVGNGLCVFFFDGQSDFFPGGIGSSLGYTNYRGPMAYNAETLGATGGGTATGSASAADMNGIKNAYVGVGFDVKGDFSTTSDGKVGTVLSAVTVNADPDADVVSSNIIGSPTEALTGSTPNSIAVRGSEADHYRLHNVSPNLNTYPLSSDPYVESYGRARHHSYVGHPRSLSAQWENQGERYTKSPPVNLHQTVATRSDVVFQSARVTLQNNGRRIFIEIKDNTTGIYYPYHVANINTTGLGSASTPKVVKAGIAFSTSDAVTNCDIKNFSVAAAITNDRKLTSLMGPNTAHNFYVVYPNQVI